MENELIGKSNSLKIVVSTTFVLHKFLNPSTTHIYNLLPIKDKFILKLIEKSQVIDKS